MKKVLSVAVTPSSMSVAMRAADESFLTRAWPVIEASRWEGHIAHAASVVSGWGGEMADGIDLLVSRGGPAQDRAEEILELLRGRLGVFTPKWEMVSGEEVSEEDVLDLRGPGARWTELEQRAVALVLAVERRETEEGEADD